MSDRKRCRTCIHFRRGMWHVSMGGGFQHGGYCRVVSAVLKLTNTELLYKEEMYVMETFGCYAHAMPNRKMLTKPASAGEG
jgi:hypothetical protein